VRSILSADRRFSDLRPPDAQLHTQFQMDRRFVTWVLLLSGCVLLVGAAATFEQRLEESAEHALRTSLLLEGPVTAAVAGMEPTAEHLPQLLHAALREGRPDQVLELLDPVGLEAYPVHAAAALFELGAQQESEATWQRADGTSSGFERRLAVARELRRQGVEDLVRDRRGRLLGGFAAAGSFEALPAVPPEVLPRAFVESLLAERPFPGRRLTIDLELSLLAADALTGARGSIVILDPASGDVLAAVSDPRTWAEGGTPALQERREPASIAKLITTSAALRAGIDPDRAIAGMTCRGAVRLSGELLYCSSVDGRLRGLDHALAVSCNVAFAQLGLLVGDDGLREEYRRFGFSVGDEPSNPFLGRVHRSRHDDRGLGDLAIGLEEADITPLHAALLGAAMARGDLPAPRLFEAADSRLGLSPRPHPGQGPFAMAPHRRLVLPSWRPVLHRAMTSVTAAGGTAAYVAPRGFPVIMKTGTGRDPGHGFHVNYIGAGPVPEPRVAFAVRITHGATSRRVRRTAYLVTERLLAGLAAGQRGTWHREIQLTAGLDRAPQPGEMPAVPLRGGAVGQ